MKKEILAPRLSVKDLRFDGSLPNGCAPDCPNCHHRNALLFERCLDFPDALFQCRDCGSLYTINMKEEPAKKVCNRCHAKPAMDSYATCSDCHEDSLSEAESHYGVE